LPLADDLAESILASSLLDSLAGFDLSDDRFVPEGRPLPGAYNVLLDSELPGLQSNGSSPYAAGNFSGDHTFVWDSYYYPTIANGALAESSDYLTSAATVDYAQVGFAFSSLMGGQAQRPSPNFYNINADTQFAAHEHSPSQLVDRSTGTPNDQGLAEWQFTPDTVTYAGGAPNAPGWKPDWSPLSIVNGDFEFPGDSNQAGTEFFSNVAPGWSHHGGALRDRSIPGSSLDDLGPEDGSARIVSRDRGIFNSVLLLGTVNGRDDTTRTHNELYVPPKSRFDNLYLAIDVQTKVSSAQDSLQVRLGNEVIGSIDLSHEDAHLRTKWLAVPDSLRDQTARLTVEVTNDAGQPVAAQVRLDNVRFESSSRSELVAKLDRVNIKGVTVITHGFQLSGTAAEGDGMMPLAQAIHQQADALEDREAWLLDYDLP
jgi:hypothetical protein